MSNIAAVLKGEIVRLARKEIRAETDQLRKTVTRYRNDIAALKRENAELSRRLSRLEKRAAGSLPALAASGEPATGIRFRADGLKKLRERLELSAPVLAGILGVSPQTIYNWESKTTRPDKEMLSRIAVLRTMGKREVRQRLELSKSAP
jgi:DNA-binding transcriptional regulator YiaG